MSLHDEEKNWGCSGFMFQAFFPGWMLTLFIAAIWAGFNDLAERTSSFIRTYREKGHQGVLILALIAYLAFMVWQGDRLWHWNVMWTDLWTSQFFIAGLGTPLAMLWQSYSRKVEEP